MWCSLEEIRHKEVIDSSTGERLGFIDDIEFDPESRHVIGFRIFGRHLFFGLIRLEADLFIPCEWVKLYGKDIVLTDSSRAIGKIDKKKMKTK